MRNLRYDAALDADQIYMDWIRTIFPHTHAIDDNTRICHSHAMRSLNLAVLNTSYTFTKSTSKMDQCKGYKTCLHIIIQPTSLIHILSHKASSPHLSIQAIAYNVECVLSTTGGSTPRLSEVNSDTLKRLGFSSTHTLSQPLTHTHSLVGSHTHTSISTLYFNLTHVPSQLKRNGIDTHGPRWGPHVLN